MSDRVLHAVLNVHGDVLAVVEGSATAAVDTARSLGATRVVVDGTAACGVEYESNPLVTLTSRMPEKALSQSGLPRLRAADVMNISLESAHAAVAPYLRKARRPAVARYATPLPTARALLGSNFKLKKKHPTLPRGEARGLSLMPAGKFFVGAGDTRHTLCVGSNEQCRAACLVHSGQNAADPYNARIKLARTAALVNEPAAFCRLLAESVARWDESITDRRPRERAFFRLNVYSDIPWELVFPDLFRLFPATQFYDYTKVAGRTTPPNYDLTFSFSGTNEKLARAELARGTRVAVVFLPSRHGGPLPPSCWGLPVIDGDEYDWRPLDPPGVIIGLRYKVPKLAGTIDEFTDFVLRVQEQSCGLTAALTPGQTPRTADEEEDD